MDGLQATRQIRKWEKEQQATRPRAQSAGNNDDAQPLIESRSHNSARTYTQTYAARTPRSPASASAHVHRIIALTADVMPGVSEECEAAGIEPLFFLRYFPFPFPFSVLLHLLLPSPFFVFILFPKKRNGWILDETAGLSQPAACGAGGRREGKCARRR